jgi:uncharacterized protein YraI
MKFRSQHPCFRAILAVLFVFAISTVAFFGYADRLVAGESARAIAATGIPFRQDEPIDNVPTTANFPIQTPLTHTVDLAAVALTQTEILTGTIFANRSSVEMRFFVDGLLYQVPPFRSTGIAQRHALTTLLLYNCSLDNLPEDPSCSWDPYLIQKDGFYEIVGPASDDAPVRLLLQEASAPSVLQAWIQNRTGHSERILFQDRLYEMENTQILELDLAGLDDEASASQVIYLRRCLGAGLRSVCEWLPTPVMPGAYYALTDTTVPGPDGDSALVTIALQPLLGSAEVTLAALSIPQSSPTVDPPAAATPAPVTAPPPAVSSIFCQIQTSVLNIRSGPGLIYAVVGQVRLTDADQGRVEVTRRDAADTWLVANSAGLARGWIINDPTLVRCEAATLALSVSSPEAVAVEPAAPIAVAQQPTPAAATSEFTSCQIQINAVNLRSGPGVDYLVIGQLRLADPNGGQFTVRGRNDDNSWLAVTDGLLPDAWIVNQSGIVLCQASTASLPVVPIGDGRLASASIAPAPQPTPGPAAALPDPTPVPDTANAAPTQTRLIVVNSFDHEIRFTLDAAQHGLPDGSPSEYDLAVGQTLEFPIRAGRVRFSASSPFRGSSGNAEIAIEPGESRTLLLRFVPSPTSEQWVLQY